MDIVEEPNKPLIYLNLTPFGNPLFGDQSDYIEEKIGSSFLDNNTITQKNQIKRGTQEEREEQQHNEMKQKNQNNMEQKIIQQNDEKNTNDKDSQNIVQNEKTEQIPEQNIEKTEDDTKQQQVQQIKMVIPKSNSNLQQQSKNNQEQEHENNGVRKTVKSSSSQKNKKNTPVPPKKYFRDRWLLFDGIIIAISIALVLVNLLLDYGQTFQSVSGSIRGIFRFLRIFLLIRKVQSFKKFKSSSRVTTHSEKIIDVLYQIREQFEETDILEDIEYAIEVIKQNKIYETNLSNKNNAEKDWITMAKVKRAENEEKPSTLIYNKRKQTIFRNANQQGFPMNTISTNCIDMLNEQVEENRFDCFEFSKIAKPNELLYLMIYIFEKYQLREIIDINPIIFVSFISKIQSSYKDNKYHSSLHAFDVVQTVNFFVKKCKFEEIAQLNDLEVASLYIAAACHDVGHPGYNNAYLVNTADDLSLLYNDQSVLEMYHIATTYEILQQDDYNIFNSMEYNDQKKMREMLISCILSTDMVKHFSDISKAKARLCSDDFEIKGKDKQMCMDLVIHSADISNPIKKWEVCFEWSHRIMEEFWCQGDKERKLGFPITYLCDRYTINIAKSQTGFIDFVARPLMEVIVNFLPASQIILDNITNNSKQWKSKEEEYQARLERLQEARQKYIQEVQQTK